MATVIIGVDIAKNVFQIHGIDGNGTATLRRKLRRDGMVPFFQGVPRDCLIAMEACGSAHHWGRCLQAMGHRVKLLPPHKVKAYVAPGKKNDANDAAAIAEAASRPHIQDVPIKSVKQQSLLMLHASREMLIRQRTMSVNALRTHLAELGIIAPRGIEKVEDLINTLENDDLPDLVRQALRPLARQIEALTEASNVMEKQIRDQAKEDEICRLLIAIPGIGPMTASLLVGLVPNISVFPSARRFASWLGLTPRQNSTGGKTRLGGISKTGNTALRCRLVLGATSLLKLAAQKAPPPQLAWATALLKRKCPRLASVALANKMARVVWAVLTRKMQFAPECWSNPVSMGMPEVAI